MNVGDEIELSVHFLDSNGDEIDSDSDDHDHDHDHDDDHVMFIAMTIQLNLIV